MKAKAAYLSKCSGDTTRISLAIDAIIDRTTNPVTSPVKYIDASVRRYFESEATRNANRPENERLGLSRFGHKTTGDDVARTIRNAETLGFLKPGSYEQIKGQLLERGTRFDSDPAVLELCKRLLRSKT